MSIHGLGVECTAARTVSGGRVGLSAYMEHLCREMLEDGAAEAEPVEGHQVRVCDCAHLLYAVAACMHLCTAQRISTPTLLVSFDYASLGSDFNTDLLLSLVCSVEIGC